MAVDLVCYIVAVVLWALAAIPPRSPGWDRMSLLALGLIAAYIPALVHAAH